MSDAIDFKCPACGRACRVSSKQRAVQHQVPNCNVYNQHRGNMQEFLKLALMAHGGLALELGKVAIDAEPSSDARKPLHAPTDRQRAASKFTEREIADATEQLYEGLKKL